MRNDHVPALERGLTILELVIHAEHPVSFTQIKRALNLASAGTVRLINVLCTRGYLVKDPASGLYMPGPRAGTLASHGTPQLDRFRTVSRPHLVEIEHETANTALSVFWNGEYMIGVAKVINESSIPMTDVGSITNNLSYMPWGWYFTMPSTTPAESAPARSWKAGRNSSPHRKPACSSFAPIRLPMTTSR